MSDLELYRRARNGSSPALAALMSRHSAPILGSLRGLDVTATSHDAMQEAWLIAIHSSSAFTGGAFQKWLGTIARRELARLQNQLTRDFLDFRRTTRRMSTVMLIGQLRAAIDELPNPEQREAARLFWVEDLTTAEIGARTSAPIKTVQSRLRLARAQLKAMLRVDPTR